MGVLQDFERRLEGAVEGMFARLFRSGLQPVELATGLQRYARDTQHVSHDGVVVPNAYRFTVNARDLERFARLGVDLPRELAEVVTGTAGERGWLLRGPAVVRVVAGDVSVGRYDLAGRIESVRPDPAPAPTPQERPKASGGGGGHTTVMSPTDAAPAAPTSTPTRATASLRVLVGGGATTVVLEGRTVAGRSAGCDVVLDDSTVSREHAAFVRRAAGWWVGVLGSMNGTKVNGRPAGEHELTDGDTIELGEAVLEFVEG